MFKCNLTCLGLVLKHVNFMETILLEFLQFHIFEEVRRYNQRIKGITFICILSDLPLGILHVTNYISLPAFCFSKPLRDA